MKSTTRGCRCVVWVKTPPGPAGEARHARPPHTHFHGARTGAGLPHLVFFPPRRARRPRGIRRGTFRGGDHQVPLPASEPQLARAKGIGACGSPSGGGSCGGGGGGGEGGENGGGPSARWGGGRGTGRGRGRGQRRGAPKTDRARALTCTVPHRTAAPIPTKYLQTNVCGVFSIQLYFLVVSTSKKVQLLQNESFKALSMSYQLPGGAALGT